MANDPQKIRFAPNGGIYMAPAPDGTTSGTTLPTTVGDGTSAPEGYKGFGYVTEDGVTITPAITTNPVTVWQSAVPVLYNVQSASFQIAATLQEVNQVTTEMFFGASWVAVQDDEGQPTGDYRLDLSSSPDLTEISLVVDWSQKGVLYRAVIPRAMISDRGAITINRTANQAYQLTIDALDYNGGLGYVLTNDDILETGSGPSSNQPFQVTVTVPNSGANDGTADWTAHVVTANQTSQATVSLLNSDGSAFEVVPNGQLQQSGSLDVTVPLAETTAQIKVEQGGDTQCFQVTNDVANAQSTTCTVVSGS